MDLARPEGIVIDGAFGLDLLNPELSELFADEQVYLRSVSEREPRPIKVLKDRTIISESARRPIEEARWEETTYHWGTLREFRDVGILFRLPLPQRPAPGEDFQIRLVHPAVARGGRRHESLVTLKRISADQWEYVEEGGEPALDLRVDSVVAQLRESGVRLTWGPMRLRVLYRVP